MTGHVGQRGEAYFYKVHVGRDPVTGKKKYEGKGGFRTREEAQAANDLHVAKIMQERALSYLKSLMSGVQDVLSPAPPSPQPPKKIMTIEQLIDKWLKAVAIQSKNTKTIDTYKSITEKRIKPALGSIYVHQLTHDDAQSWVISMQEEVDARGRKLAPQTIKNYFVVLKTALHYAKNQLKLIDDNPVLGVALPPIPRDRRQVVSPQQVQEILGLLQGTRAYMPTFLGFHTGLRMGEILGLFWSCIDFDAGTLEVKRSLKSITGEGLVLGTPKSESSYRTIALNKLTLTRLREHQEQQKCELAEIGKQWTSNGPIIVNKKGKYCRAQSITDPFKETSEELGYSLTFHATRHAHATIALKEGVPMKVVSERLGHSSIVTTMNQYAHVLEGMDQEAADAFERGVN